VQVEFGNPKKRDCAGLGICNLEMLGHQWPARKACCEHRRAVGHLSYIRSGNEFVLQFRRSDLDDEAYARHFVAGAFLLEEDFSIPPAVVQACGLPRSALFPRGQYPFLEWEEQLRISFPNTPVALRAFPMTNFPGLGLNTIAASLLTKY
jgi:hypothetical protein